MSSPVTLDDYLEHYGVKGMKWGVRRSREQLANARKSARSKFNESVARGYEKRAEKTQKSIDRIQGERGLYSETSRKTILKSLETQKADDLQNAKRAREGKLTDGQKKALKGAAIGVGVLAAVGAYTALQSGEGHRLKEKGRALLNGKDPSDLWNTKQSLMGEMSQTALEKNVIAQINPDFGQLGTTMNCRRCTFAYEMRRRGYDVAATKTTNGHGQTLLGVDAATTKGKLPRASGKLATMAAAIRKSAEEGTDIQEFTRFGKHLGEEHAGRNAFEFFDTLAKKPNGSRGELSMQWSSGGAHSMAWEIVGGKPVIFDTQRRVTYTSAESWVKDTKIPRVANGAITRLDNKELNTDFLGRWVKGA